MSTGSEKVSSASSKKMKGKGVRANKKVLILVAVIVALVLAGSGVLIALISASNAKAAEAAKEFAALSKDCATVRSNLTQLSSWPAFLVDLQYAETGFIITNLGNESRGKYKESILENFPYLEAFASSEAYTSSETESEEIWLAKMSIAGKGTRFDPAFTPEEIEEFKTGALDTQTTEAEVYGSYGLNTAEDKKRNEALCWGVDEVESRGTGVDKKIDEPSTEEALNAWESHASEIVMILRAINDCQDDGFYSIVNERRPCATADYDGSRADYSPLPPRDPFVNPFTDKNLQTLAVISWCDKLGLEAKADLTGCM